MIIRINCLITLSILREIPNSLLRSISNLMNHEKFFKNFSEVFLFITGYSVVFVKPFTAMMTKPQKKER